MELSLFWTLWLLIAIFCLGMGIKLTFRRWETTSPERPLSRINKDCQKCGQWLQREDRYCGHCGRKVPALPGKRR